MMRLLPGFFANPVAIKELRQVVRSRSIAIGLCLYMLLLSIVGIAVASSGANWSGDPVGGRVFSAVRFVMIMTLGLLAPLLAGFRAIAEMDPSRKDVLFTTTLPPAR